MHSQGIAPEAAITEEDGLPKRIEAWQMGGPIDLGNAVEDLAEDFVLPDLVVEAVNYADDLGASFDVRGGRLGFAHEGRVFAF
jgi:hypothetical protein